MADVQIQSYTAYFELKINGASAENGVMADMLECTVENSIHLPDLCTLRLFDGEFTYMDGTTFAESTLIEIQAGMEGDAALKTLFKGEVVGLEIDFASGDAPTTLVRCLSRAHRLHRGRKTQSFVQMKASDIVTKVGQAAGFTVTVEDTTVVHDWILQNNQTDWEFLTLLATRCGYRLYVSGEKDLHFKKVQSAATETIELSWGNTLRSFRPRTAASPQVDEVTVRGWDVKTKQAIVGKATKAVGTPQEVTITSDTARQTFGAAKMIVVDRPVFSQTEADDLARSLCDEIGGSYLEADGLCFSQPDLLPGKSVKISKVGPKFSGTYFVTSTLHTYTPAEGYTTLFTVTGKRASTLLTLLEDGTGTRRAPLGGSLVIALVTNNNDDKKEGRVKVKYPWLTEDHESDWIRIASPMGGSARGFHFLPEVNDEVLVGFEHGDIRRPYILGALWSPIDLPPEGNDKAVVDSKVVHRRIKTRIGHELLFDDTDETGEVKVTTKSGHSFTLNDTDKHITAKTKAGHKVFLDDTNNQIVVVDKTGNNKITINAQDNSMKLECIGDFKVDAKGKVTIMGASGIELTTPQAFKAQGASGIELQTGSSFKAQAGAGVDIQSGGMLGLKSGGPASLETAAILTIMGALVKIN